MPILKPDKNASAQEQFELLDLQRKHEQTLIETGICNRAISAVEPSTRERINMLTRVAVGLSKRTTDDGENVEDIYVSLTTPYINGNGDYGEIIDKVYVVSDFPDTDAEHLHGDFSLQEASLLRGLAQELKLSRTTVYYD